MAKSVRNSKGQFVVTTGARTYKACQRNGRRRQKSHVVWEDYHNKEVPKGQVIHHINGDKTDDRPENLQLMTYTEHNQLHAKDRKIWNKGLTVETSEKWAEAINKVKRVRRAKRMYNGLMTAYLREMFSAKEVGEMLGICDRQVYTRIAKYKEETGG